jgi:hypothetical protein
LQSKHQLTAASMVHVTKLTPGSANPTRRRLAEIIDAFRTTAGERQKSEVGRVHLCLVQGVSKKNERELTVGLCTR